MCDQIILLHNVKKKDDYLNGHCNNVNVLPENCR